MDKNKRFKRTNNHFLLKHVFSHKKFELGAYKFIPSKKMGLKRQTLPSHPMVRMVKITLCYKQESHLRIEGKTNSCSIKKVALNRVIEEQTYFMGKALNTLP